MKSEQLRALPPIKEIFKGIGDLSEAMVEQAKEGNLSEEELSAYLKDLKEMVKNVESMKKSLKEK